MISKQLFVLLACLFVVMIGLGITMTVLPFYVERLALADGVSRQSVVMHVSLLMAGALFNLAVSAGIEEIVVKMMASQTAALRIFPKLGFRHEVVLRDYVKDMRGDRKDLVLMRCRLQDLWQKYEDFVRDTDMRSFRME